MKNLMENKILQKCLIWAMLLASAGLVIAGLIYATNFRYFGSDLIGYNLKNTLQTLADEEWVADNFTTAQQQAKVLANYKDFVNGYYLANNWVFFTGVIGVALFAVLCVFGNKYRKKYYLSNFIVGIVVPAIMIILTVACIILNIKVFGLFSDSKETLSQLKKIYDISNYYPLSLGYCYAALALQIIAGIVFALDIVYAVLKYIVSRSNDSEVAFNETEELKEVTE